MKYKQSIIFMLLSALSFSLMQVFVKLTSDEVNLFIQVFMRNAVILIGCLFVIFFKKIPMKVTKKKKALFLRCLCGYLGVVLYFYAIKGMHLANSSALQKTSPFFVLIISAIFLKEKINFRQIIAISLAFMGVLFIIKPGLNYVFLPSIAALLSALFAAFAYVMISFIGEDIESVLIIFYFSLFSCLASIFFIDGLFDYSVYKNLVYLILLGVFGGLGQLFLTKAYRMVSPGKISIYNFSTIIFSTILGYIIFHESLDILSILGIVVIIIGGYLNNRASIKRG